MMAGTYMLTVKSKDSTKQPCIVQRFSSASYNIKARIENIQIKTAMLKNKENEGNRRGSRRRSLRSGLVSFSIICCADTLAYGQKPKHKSGLEMEAMEEVLVMVEYGNSTSLFAICCNMEIRFCPQWLSVP